MRSFLTFIRLGATLAVASASAVMAPDGGAKSSGAAAASTSTSSWPTYLVWVSVSYICMRNFLSL